MGSSLLGELLGFAVSYWPTRSGAAFRRCSARASAQSAPLGASLVIGQPLPAAGAGVGTAQLPKPHPTLAPHVRPAIGYVCCAAEDSRDASSARNGWRRRLVPGRPSRSRRAPAPSSSPGAAAATDAQRLVSKRQTCFILFPSHKLPARQHDALRFRGRAAEREVEHEQHDDDGGRGAHGHVLPVLAARREVCAGGERHVSEARAARIPSSE